MHLIPGPPASISSSSTALASLVCREYICDALYVHKRWSWQETSHQLQSWREIDRPTYKRGVWQKSTKYATPVTSGHMVLRECMIAHDGLQKQYHEFLDLECATYAHGLKWPWIQHVIWGQVRRWTMTWWRRDGICRMQRGRAWQLTDTNSVHAGGGWVHCTRKARAGDVGPQRGGREPCSCLRGAPYAVQRSRSVRLAHQVLQLLWTCAPVEGWRAVHQYKWFFIFNRRGEDCRHWSRGA